MSLTETLVIEAKATEMTSKEDEEEQILLESGWQWAPRSWVTKGDVKEMQGLIDKGCLKFVTSVPDGAKVISSKVVRTFKGDGVKSRLVLRDIAHGKPNPQEENSTRLRRVSQQLEASRRLRRLGKLAEERRASCME